MWIPMTTRLRLRAMISLIAVLPPEPAESLMEPEADSLKSACLADDRP
jgi:hypothetical protein